jgi:hypothetical protein
MGAFDGLPIDREAGELVEQVQMHVGVEEGLVFVLAVQVDEA